MKKGFTLVELLAVIAVLGVLIAISVPSFLEYLDEASESGMKSQEANVKDAAKLYIEDHCNNPLYGYTCPNSYTNPNSGQEKYICLSDLQNDKNISSGIEPENYLDKIEYDNSICDGVITFTKSDTTTNSGYTVVTPYLICGYDYAGMSDYITDNDFPYDSYSKCLENN